MMMMINGKCTFNQKSFKDSWSYLSHYNSSLLRYYAVSAGMTGHGDEDTTMVRNVGNTLTFETTLHLRIFNSLAKLLW